jgi:LuxR family maltose regulon positive regulatory protein
MNRVLFCAQEYQKRVDRLNFSKSCLLQGKRDPRPAGTGCKHEEIGERLFISVTTVRYHIKNIYQKLEVNNKVLAIKKAQELKLL